MTTRTFVDKNGNSWEWDETPEVVAALKELHKTNENATDTKAATVE